MTIASVSQRIPSEDEVLPGAADLPDSDDTPVDNDDKMIFPMGYAWPCHSFGAIVKTGFLE
jgi:hypothetical protein